MAQALSLVRSDFDHKLTQAVDSLKSYRGQDVDRDIADFAEAEVQVDDPLQATAREDEDAFGIGDLFAHPLEP